MTRRMCDSGSMSFVFFSQRGGEKEKGILEIMFMIIFVSCALVMVQS